MVSRENEARAREIVRADERWGDIEARVHGASFTSLEERLAATPALAVGREPGDVLGELVARGNPAAQLLRDPTVVERGGSAWSVHLKVVEMRVIQREYLSESGELAHGCEVFIALRSPGERWGRRWWGEVAGKRVIMEHSIEGHLRDLPYEDEKELTQGVR